MIDAKLIDYDKCHEYAADVGFPYGIPACDIGDIGSEAFLLAIRRAWHAVADNDVEALANRIMYTAVVDVIRRRNKRSERIISEATEINATSEVCGEPTDDEEADTGIVISDEGKGAKYILLDYEEPFWLKLFRNERRKLKSTAQKIVKALMKDSRLPIARSVVKISRPAFLTIIKKLKVHFALCFQLLCEYCAQK